MKTKSLPDLNNFNENTIKTSNFKKTSFKTSLPNLSKPEKSDAGSLKNKWEKFELDKTEYELILKTLPDHKKNTLNPMLSSNYESPIILSDLMKDSLSTKKKGCTNNRDDFYVYNNKLQKQAFDLDQKLKKYSDIPPSIDSLNYACEQSAKNIAKEYKKLKDKQTTIAECQLKGQNLIQNYFAKMENVCYRECEESARRYLNNTIFTLETTKHRAVKNFNKNYKPYINTLKHKFSLVDIDLAQLDNSKRYINELRHNFNPENTCQPIIRGTIYYSPSGANNKASNTPPAATNMSSTKKQEPLTRLRSFPSFSTKKRGKEKEKKPTLA